MNLVKDAETMLNHQHSINHGCLSSRNHGQKILPVHLSNICHNFLKILGFAFNRREKGTRQVYMSNSPWTLECHILFRSSFFHASTFSSTTKMSKMLTAYTFPYFIKVDPQPPATSSNLFRANNHWWFVSPTNKVGMKDKDQSFQVRKTGWPIHSPLLRDLNLSIRTLALRMYLWPYKWSTRFDYQDRPT